MTSDSMMRPHQLTALAWLWCAALAVAMFWANIQNNQISFWHHPDEELKTLLIGADTRDMCHPNLMLEATKAAVKIWDVKMARQPVTEAGRTVCAFFAAVAVGVMALLAWRIGGAAAGVFAGLLLFSDHDLIDSARFFKEDPALLAGWALALLAMSYFLQRRTVMSAVLMGAAGGLCASGKYIGVVVALACVAIALIYGAQGRRARTAWLCTGAALLVWCAVNYRMFADLKLMFSVINREVVQQARNDTGSDPAWLLLVRTLSWAGALVVCAAIWRWFKDRASVSTTERAALVIAAAYFIPLCFILRLVPRYMLPVYITVWWSLGLTLAWLVTSAPLARKLRLTCGGLIAAALIGTQLHGAWTKQRGYAGEDTYLTMARFVDRELPADAVVGYDLAAKMPDATKRERHIDGFRPRQKMVYVPRRGDLTIREDLLTELPGKGLTHIIVNTAWIERYRTGNFTREYGQFGDFNVRRPFYELLLRQQPLFQTREGLNRFVSPELRLYKLPDAAPPKTAD